MKIYISIILIVFLSRLQSQTKFSESSLAKSINEFNNYNYLTSLKYTIQTIELAKKEDEKEILLNAKILLAKIYYEKGSFYNALRKIDEIEDVTPLNVKSKIELKKVKGKIFREMNLFDASKSEFNEQFLLSNQLTNEEKYINQIEVHESLMKLYSIKGTKDSIKLHLDNQYKLLKFLDKKKSPHLFYTTYLNYAEYLIKERDFKNAIIFINKSKLLLDNNNFKNTYPYYAVKAKFHLFKGEFISCREELMKALSVCKTQGKRQKELEIYKNLTQFDNDKLNLDEYFEFYTILNDSINMENIHLNDLAYSNILKHQEKKSKNNFLLVISIFVLLFVIAIIILIKYYKNYRKVNLSIKKTVPENSSDDLKFRLLIELVTSNDPKFLVLFKELYPEFINKIKQINPNVRSSELSFLAMCYLNLSTKDIAEYTFVTVRAVQIRKNRLRKKFNISSNLDFNSAVRNLNSYDS